MSPNTTPSAPTTSETLAARAAAAGVDAAATEVAIGRSPETALVATITPA
jgi:hypothetical protein